MALQIPRDQAKCKGNLRLWSNIPASAQLSRWPFQKIFHNLIWRPWLRVVPMRRWEGDIKKCMSRLIYIEMAFLCYMKKELRLKRAQWAEFEVPANEGMDTWCLDSNIPLYSLKCTSKMNTVVARAPEDKEKEKKHTYDQNFSSDI